MRRLALLVLVLVAGVIALDVPVASAAPTAYTQTTIDGEDLIYSVDLATGQASLVGDTGLEPSTAALTFGVDGELYGINDGDLVTVDTTTGQATVVGPTGSSGFSDMAVDDQGVLWALGANPSRLFRIDTATGAATNIGPLDQGLLGGLDADCEGDMWASDPTDDELLAIDTTAVSATPIGPLGIDILGSYLASDSSGQAWMMASIASNQFVRSSYTVDTGSGAATLVASPLQIPNVANGLAIQGETCPEDTTTTGAPTSTTARPASAAPVSAPAAAVTRTPAFTG